MKNIRGFTLTELMITLAIVAILLSLAVPSFNSIIRESRLSTQANELISALNLARSEAIKRGLNVTVTPVGGNWNGGWTIATTDPGGAAVTLRTFDAVQSNLSFTGGDASYTFSPAGYQSDFTGTDDGAISGHTLCDTTAPGTPGRMIIVTPVGRPRVTTIDC